MTGKASDSIKVQEWVARKAYLEQLRDECRVFLRDTRFITPLTTAASPDAVLAIVHLDNELEFEVANLTRLIEAEDLPF